MRSRVPRNTLSIVLVIAVFVSGFALGSLRPAASVAAAPVAPDQKTQQLFEPFWQAWNTMHRSYVDRVDDNALMEGALTGMMDSVGDPHTNYFDPKTYQSISDEMAGQFGGIGATMKKDDKTGAFSIVSTLKDSPARKAGLTPGDVIVQVNGEDVTKLTQTRVVSKVRGPNGTDVTLGVLRDGKDPLQQITITRAVIKLETVTTRRYEGGIGYISLQEFNDVATAELHKGLKALNANALKGLILDLRGDPGGYLNTAVDLVGQFVTEGAVLIERGRNGRDVVHNVETDAEALAPDVPLIVLVDGGSASASEVVSGALQDHQRALILGSQTFGKGSMQIFEPLSNGGVAHVTIARWFTPSGRSIQDVGVTPDIKVTWDVKAAPDRDVQLEQAILILRGET